MTGPEGYPVSQAQATPKKSLRQSFESEDETIQDSRIHKVYEAPRSTRRNAPWVNDPQVLESGFLG